MPEPVRQIKPAPKSVSSYRLRLWAGWILYVTGWAAWFISLLMPAAYASRGAAEPIKGWLYVGLAFLELLGGLASFSFTLTTAVFAGYFLGLGSAAISPGLRRWRRSRWAARAVTLGSLIGCYLGWRYLREYRGFDRFCPGLPTLAAASILICLGVWMIPLRQKHKDTVAADVASEPQAGPASRIGGE